MTISMTISSTFPIFPQFPVSPVGPVPAQSVPFSLRKTGWNSTDLRQISCVSPPNTATPPREIGKRGGRFFLGSIPTIGWAILTNKNGSKWGFYMFLHETGKLGFDTFEARLRCSVTASCGGFATNVSSDFTGLLSAILKPSTNTAA